MSSSSTAAPSRSIRISRIATVYRTVRLFEEANILERHDFGDGRARYEEMPETHHDHLIDIQTGEVIEFQNEEIEALQRKVAEQLGYQLVGHRLELLRRAASDARQAPKPGEGQALMAMAAGRRSDSPVEHPRRATSSCAWPRTRPRSRAAQALRYRVFYEEMSAEPTAEMARLRRDFDSFDDYCDHLLVIDRALPAGRAGVVGTYRLLRRAVAAQRGQFYSVDEYDIAPILAYPGEILELGRSCIEPAYRQRSTMQLMWRGIADYVMYHEIGLMFGCASLPGIDPDGACARRSPISITIIWRRPICGPRALPVALCRHEHDAARCGRHAAPPSASCRR